MCGGCRRECQLDRRPGRCATRRDVLAHEPLDALAQIFDAVRGCSSRDANRTISIRRSIPRLNGERLLFIVEVKRHFIPDYGAVLVGSPLHALLASIWCSQEASLSRLPWAPAARVHFGVSFMMLPSPGAVPEFAQ